MYRLILLSLLLSLTFFAEADEKAVKLTDPTQPLWYRAVTRTKTALKLQAIFYGDGRKEAIINGKAVKEGAYVDGRQIIEIRRESVVYRADGVRRTLKLRGSIFD